MELIRYERKRNYRWCCSVLLNVSYMLRWMSLVTLMQKKSFGWSDILYKRANGSF